MKRSKRTVRAALCGPGAAILLVSGFACADEAKATIVNVAGTSYAVYEGDGVAIGVPVPVTVRLVRDAHQPAPPCSQLEATLATYRELIEDCKQPENASSGTCKSIAKIIERLSKEPGSFEAPYLRQGWSVERIAPPSLPPESAAKQEIAEATGLARSSVFVQTAVVGIDRPRNVWLHVKPGGSSLASSLVGFMDVDASAISYRANAKRFVTEDHILACGLLAGDVVPLWEQDATLEAPGGSMSPARTITARLSWRAVEAH